MLTRRLLKVFAFILYFDQVKMASISKLQHRESDRLSTLPDEIRIHILSHSKTRYAVRTSILSKRWRNIWANVPNLDFDDEDTHDDWFQEVCQSCTNLP